VRRAKSLRAAALAALALGVAACAPPRPLGTPAPALGVVWTPVDSLNARLPPDVRVLAGRSESLPLRAWAVRLGPGVALRVLTAADTADGRDRPSTLAAQTGACVVLNGGYFNMTTGAPVGLVLTDGSLRAAAFSLVERDSLTYPVARGAVGIRTDGALDLRWARSDGATACALDAPLPNRPDTPADAPRTCVPWAVRDALGAGPMVVRNGRPAVSADAEVFFGTSIPATHPRSAIGRAADGAALLVVVDGRQDASRGVTLDELAALLLSLGAVDGLNLDGGGSSALVVDGVRLNRPTGGTVEREVSNGIGAFCARPAP
jgi:hypothetical protein